MNLGRFVFSQVVNYLPSRVFDRCVEHYKGNKYVKHFTCWNQMLCMLFGQLSGRDSLRDLIISLSAHKSKYYHLGLGVSVTRSTLSDANEQRDYRIFEEFAVEMIAQARICCRPEEDFFIDNAVYAFDSTVIDLCLNVFWWAEFRTTKAAVKVHTLYDVRTSIPAFVYITNGSTHDVNVLDELTYEGGGFYLLDRGYIDFKRLYAIHEKKAFFVTRAKDNFRFVRKSSNKVIKSSGIMCDQTINVKGYYTLKDYPDTLRRIKFFDKETNSYLIFLTNNFLLPAEQIALLYKHRWRVELFFKWIKQHLKVKTFWGTSPNAVRVQIYIAIITYTTIAIIKAKLKTKLSTYEILQILSVSLLDKMPLKELLTDKTMNEKCDGDMPNQLKINLS
jgi:hypothetical protein